MDTLKNKIAEVVDDYLRYHDLMNGEEVADKILTLISKKADGSKVPCSAGLWGAIVDAPKDRTPILICTDYGKMATAYWNGEAWVDWMRPYHSYGGVTHWMYLPKTP